MQLAWLAIHAQTAVVIDAKREVAALLYLGQHNAFADGMHTSGRDIEHVSGVNTVLSEHGCDVAFGNEATIFLRIDGRFEARIEIGSGLS